MKKAYYLFKHELWLLWITPATYCAAVLFLGLMGFIFMAILQSYGQSPQELAPMTVFFQVFWIPVFFVVPLLTMRTFAEGRRLGTLEALCSVHVSAEAVVISKFCAVLVLYYGFWLSTLSFPVLISWKLPHVAREAELWALGPLVGGYSFIALSGFLYIAVGIFFSSLSRSQLMAAILTFTSLFFLLLGGRVLQHLVVSAPDSYWLQSLRDMLAHFQALGQLEAFSQGILDSRVVIFYLSLGIVCLMGASWSLKRWA